ncbi:MAG: hypothetical protein Q9228_002223 [Teloschistes exilis]
MTIVYIYVALAAYNTEYLTLPMNSVENIVDETANIATLDDSAVEMLHTSSRPDDPHAQRADWLSRWNEGTDASAEAVAKFTNTSTPGSLVDQYEQATGARGYVINFNNLLPLACTVRVFEREDARRLTKMERYLFPFPWGEMTHGAMKRKVVEIPLFQYKWIRIQPIRREIYFPHQNLVCVQLQNLRMLRRAETARRHGDCRLPHDSGTELPLNHLSILGILYYFFPPWSPSSSSAVEELASSREYANRDEITISADAMGAAYEEKVKMFFEEHMHEDEEIRYILAGNGFFDVRDADDR